MNLKHHNIFSWLSFSSVSSGSLGAHVYFMNIFSNIKISYYYTTTVDTFAARNQWRTHTCTVSSGAAFRGWFSVEFSSAYTLVDLKLFFSRF